MKISDVIAALERIKIEMQQYYYYHDENDCVKSSNETKGGYFRVGNVAIKISEITELKQ